MGLGYIYALGARLFVISFFDFNGMNFLNYCTRVVSHIRSRLIMQYMIRPDHMDTSIEDMVIGRASNLNLTR